jgi:hypothetical protein
MSLHTPTTASRGTGRPAAESEYSEDFSSQLNELRVVGVARGAWVGKYPRGETMNERRLVRRMRESVGQTRSNKVSPQRKVRHYSAIRRFIAPTFAILIAASEFARC